MTATLVLFSFAVVCFAVNMYLLGLLWFADKRTAQVQVITVLGTGIACWTLFDAIALLARPELYGFLYILRSVALVLSSYYFFIFNCELNESGFLHRRWLPRLIDLVPLADIVLVVSNPLHRLVFAKDDFPLPEYGPLFIFHSAVAYLSILLGFILLVRFLIVRKPPLWFIASVSLVIVAGIFLNVLFTLKILIAPLDSAPYIFFGIYAVLSIYIYLSRLMRFKATAMLDVFQSYKDAALLVDPRGIIADNNEAFLAMFPGFAFIPQRSPVEGFYLYLEEIVPGWNRAAKEITLPSGQNVTITRQGIKIGKKPQGFILLLSDISVYRKMIRREEELRTAAESASRAKSAFLATMSHEIRTPLNAIIGLADIQIQKENEGAAQTSEERRRDILKIRNSGNDLLNIINDILDISKIEAGGFRLVPVEYETARMIHNTVQLNRVRIGSKPIGFTLEVDPSLPKKLYGDELRVKQILNNLLSNAIKYTAQGTVRLSVRWEPIVVDEIGNPDPQGTLVCAVSDTGQGIKDADLDKLFSEYAQLDVRANRKVEGTGLGLSITKRLAEMMGGDITVESVYGKGSVFQATFVQGCPQAETLGEAVAADLEAGRYWESAGSDESFAREYMPYGRVLIVDDVDINLEVAQGIMEPYGLQIDLAESGQEALDKVRDAALGRTEPYDLIFMDHMMPGMDGMEATRIIREELGSLAGAPGRYAKNVPIIALTANAITGNEELFLAKGFTGFISKPIDLRSLDVTLNQYVKK